MPTKHRRIAVIQDDEVRQAMKRASVSLPGKSDAALLRELALIGARTISNEGNVSRGVKDLLERPGVRAPEGDIREFLREHPPGEVPEESDPYGLTKALQEQREERL